VKFLSRFLRRSHSLASPLSVPVAPLPSRKVIILGLPKSGTTALFYGVRNAFPTPPNTLFEPATAAAITEGLQHAQFLTKVLPTAWPTPFPGALLAEFTHRIFIVRDPRDVLVSLMLYIIWNTKLHQDEPAVRAWLEVLEQKRRHPHSISLCELLSVNASWQQQTLEQELARFTPATDLLLQLQQQAPPHCIVRYEDMVAEQLTEVEHYLDRPIPRPLQVDSTEIRVVRTCGTGSWQHWFTPADEPILRPLLAAYMQAYGYDRDWSLSPTPTISAAHSTDYVLRIVNQKRAQEKLVPLA
jgi:hypothetical protein